MTKNVQKWPKSRVFLFSKKTLSSDLSGICIKWKFLWFNNTAENACLGKTWSSSYSQKWLPANEISIFFNRQYFTNRLMSHFDFWHVDRHEWKEQGSLRGFLKKFSSGQMSHFMPKNCTALSLWICWKVSFEILHNKKCQQVGESNNGLCQKKFSGQMDHFVPKNSLCW